MEVFPAKSPHSGGIWEAGVKTVKHHLYRVLGNTILSYEQFSTVIYQIESCVNSRPLYPLSNDPSDILSLTPAHFLISEFLISIPHYNWMEISMNRLSKFYKASGINGQRSICISHLQRVKWKEHSNALLKPGVLVMCKGDNLPPLKWSISRIINTHPSKDNIVRTVTLKTFTG